MQGHRGPSPTLERVSPRVAAVCSTPREPRVPAGLGVYGGKRAGSSHAPPDPGSKPWPQHRLHQQCSPVTPWQSRMVRPGASEASSVLETHCPTPSPQPTSGLSAGLSRLSPTRSCQQGPRPVSRTSGGGFCAASAWLNLGWGASLATLGAPHSPVSKGRPRGLGTRSP